MAEALVNEFVTTLGEAISDTDTTFDLTDAPPAGLAGGNFRLRIGAADEAAPEYILVGSVSGVTLSGVTRHVEGSSTASWGAGTVVAQVVTVAGLADAIASGGGGATDPVADLFGAPDTAFEFDTSSLTGLTAMGSADTEDADTTFAGHYYVADNDASQVGRYASVSAPFTAVVKMTSSTCRENFQYIGAFCGEATPGKMVFIGYIAIGTVEVSMRTMASPGDGSPGTPTVVTQPFLGPTQYPCWFGIRAASNTDVSYYWSRDGSIWYPMLLAHDFSMTVGSVGMSLCQYSAGAKAAQGAYDYLRIWNSALTFPAFS